MSNFDFLDVLCVLVKVLDVHIVPVRLLIGVEVVDVQTHPANHSHEQVSETHQNKPGTETLGCFQKLLNFNSHSLDVRSSSINNVFAKLGLKYGIHLNEFGKLPTEPADWSEDSSEVALFT